MLGCGTWTAAVFMRGGTVRHPNAPVELTVTQMSLSRALNRTSEARMTLACSDVEIRPWEHEIHLFRDGQREWIGVPSFPTLTQTEIRLEARDLSAWFDRRIIERDLSFKESDLGDIFRTVAEAGLERDTSPNIDVDAATTGILTTRFVGFVDRRMTGEELRELVPLGLNWTTDKRSVVARGREDMTLLPGYLLDDHLDARTSAPLFETYSEATVLGVNEDVVGTFGGVGERTGLVQAVLTGQSRVLDDITAIEVAQVTVEVGGSDPMELNGILLPSAGYSFSDLVPGRVLDGRVSTGARQILELLRLDEVRVEVRPGNEEVAVKLVSL